MKKIVHDFSELNVYRNAMDAAIELYEITKGFPSEERYSMTTQMRRSSRSVCANIAEAWMKRLYRAAFVAKLSDSLMKPPKPSYGWRWPNVVTILNRNNASNWKTITGRSLGNWLK